MIEAVFSSNAIQTILPFLIGGGAILLASRWRHLIPLAGYTVSLGIAIGFVFNVGEVYSYSDFYERRPLNE